MTDHTLLFNNGSALAAEPIEPSAGFDLDNNSTQNNASHNCRRTRDEVLKLRLTSEEKQLIASRAAEAEMSITDFIMASVTGSQIVVVEKIPQLYVELRRQGNNLNQALRIAHQTDGSDLSSIEEAAKSCSAAHNKLIKFCNFWNVKIKKSSEKKED